MICFFKTMNFNKNVGLSMHCFVRYVHPYHLYSGFFYFLLCDSKSFGFQVPQFKVMSSTSALVHVPFPPLFASGNWCRSVVCTRFRRKRQGRRASDVAAPTRGLLVPCALAALTPCILEMPQTVWERGRESLCSMVVFILFSPCLKVRIVLQTI